MTVGELIAELQKEDPNAKVGVSATYVHRNNRDEA